MLLFSLIVSAHISYDNGCWFGCLMELWKHI